MTNADEIVKVLKSKHVDDVFIAECKNGPTQTANHLRFDAWAMVKSWASPCCTGYEVKVSRSDFVQDKKWHGYLPYCNQFYFVCPSKLIDVSEVGEHAGLMYVCGSRAITKKKAPYRDVEIPESIFRYILMCRAKIGHEIEVGQSNRSWRIDDWRQWLAQKKENRDLGYRVGKQVREHVATVEANSLRLKSENESFSTLRASMLKLGLIDADDRHISAWAVERKIAALNVVPCDLDRQLRNIKRELDNVVARIDQLKDQRRAA